MNNRKPEDVVFEATVSFTLFVAVTAITALLYQLITVAVPRFESMVFPRVLAQGASRTLVAVFAHGDDEGAAAPILARYAREGVQVYVILATDGAQGAAHTSIPRGQELARVGKDDDAVWRRRPSSRSRSQPATRTPTDRRRASC